MNKKVDDLNTGIGIKPQKIEDNKQQIPTQQIYKDTLNSGNPTPVNGNGSGSNGSGSNGSGSVTPTDVNNGTNNYYNNLRQESYRAMLNSEIQANIAKNQALKYTQNALAEQGLGTQGVSESTRTGIMNNYQNAKSQAVDTYRNELLGINADERKEQLEEYEKNGQNLYDALQDRITYDEDGNAKVNTDSYNETLEGYGAKLIKDENGKIIDIDFSDSPLNESDKLILKDAYLKVLNGEEDGGSKTSEPTEPDYVYGQKNTAKIENLDVKGINQNFNYKLNGIDSTWELGGKVGAYPNYINATSVKKEAIGKKIGDAWLHQQGNTICAVIKSNNSTVRAFEASNSSKNPDLMYQVFNSLGMSLEKTKYADSKNAGRVLYLDKKTGKYYSLNYRGDGFMWLEKTDKPSS